jgi:hypothetical protein
MGQQQLLLLVLGIVLVGLAVVVGIDAFGENDRKSSYDAMTLAAQSVATDMIAWRMKPKALGGGQQTSAAAPFEGVELSRLGYSVQTQPTGIGALAGEWADLGGGMWARMGSQASARPSVTVRNTRQPDLVVDLLVWGPAPECFLARLGWIEGGSFVYTLNGADLDKPAACTAAW